MRNMLTPAHCDCFAVHNLDIAVTHQLKNYRLTIKKLADALKCQNKQMPLILTDFKGGTFCLVIFVWCNI